MIKAISIGVLTVTGALALSGCQLFETPRLAKAAGRHLDDQNGMQASHGLAIEEGRGHLRANRSGMAIDAFNRGLAQGEDPAAAYNGLGVAYARIGRSDLAYRFFKKASVSDPENPTYWRNLAMLIDSPEYQRGLAAREARPNADASGSQRDLSPVATAKAAGVQLVREPNRQFSLVTVVPEVTPDKSDTGSALVRCGTRASSGPCRNPNLSLIASRNQESRRSTQTGEESTRTDATPPGGKRKTVDLTTPSPRARTEKAIPKEAPQSDGTT